MKSQQHFVALKLGVVLALGVMGCSNPQTVQGPTNHPLNGVPVADLVQMVVWNRANGPIALEVKQGDSVVLANTIASPSLPSAIGASQILRLEPTGIALGFLDRTNGKVASKAFSRAEINALKTPVIVVTLKETGIDVALRSSFDAQ